MNSVNETRAGLTELAGAAEIGRMVHARDDATCEIQSTFDNRIVRCQYLESAWAECATEYLDRDALFMVPKGSETGVVIGWIRQASDASHAPALPERLRLEAKQELTLVCGDGSVRIRKDGKVVVRGLDVITRATRNNKIKGGSVQIN